MRRHFGLLIASSVICFNLFAQGTITGKVTDAKTGEAIPFAKIKVVGENNGVLTDFDGLYKIEVSINEITLLFSMKSDLYEDQEKMISVVDNKVVTLNVQLAKSSSYQEIKELVVRYVKTEGATSIAADDKRRRDAQGSSDGITKEQMQNTGASTAVDALQMVPGLAVEDGKSVYVRGLGDRYTKTVLNGMEIPGLDPDRNSVQMDIFPSNIIDNITVYKTFTPNLTGDFTGGLVDITTKDFPSTENLLVKASLGYNSTASFNSNYISYQGGKYDFLGFDDGTRQLPIRTTDKFLDPVLNDPSLTRQTSSFSNIMATEKSKNFLNQNYAISYGNRLSKVRKTKSNLDYGYNVVLNYKNTHNFFEDVEFNEYRKDTDLSITKLYQDRTSKGVLAQNDIMWTALVGQAVKWRKNKLAFTVMRTQNGQSSVSNLIQENSESNPATLVKQSLQYTQRSVSTANLNGRHYLDEKSKWKLDWKLTPTYSTINDPDIRSTVLEKIGNGDTAVYALYQSVGAEIRRTFRKLKEYNLSGRFDLSYDFRVWDSLPSKLQFGALNTFKKRTFDVYDYIFNVYNPTSYSQDPNWYFQEENIWTSERGTGTYGTGEQQKANSFIASQNVMGAYMMNELPITKAFKATYGVRVEYAINNYTGENNLGSVQYINERVLDELSVLPSVNLVYKIEKEASEKKAARYTNIRGAYTETVARPSFKEKSISQIYDPIQGRRYNGNIDLLQTSIKNADLRYEYFYGRTELISASVFYKHFINPIEVVANVAAPNEVQPVNAGVADVYGAELEFRKAIGFDKRTHLSLVAGANLTYVLSRIDMNQVKTTVGGTEYTEKEVRQMNARDEEIIGNYRPMFGQSPYIVNGFVTFKNDSLGLVFNTSYNVQGKKLAVVGVGSLPDVYERPFHSLNMKISKTVGADRRWMASISAKNLLKSKRAKYYESYNADSQLYELFNEGMVITGSISYTFRAK